MAASVSDDLREVLNAMFPGAVPDNFYLGRTKLSYLITEALGPYFWDKLLFDLRKSAFSLLYDETVNNAEKKDLQLVARFWSENEKQVISRYLKTFFGGGMQQLMAFWKKLRKFCMHQDYPTKIY